MLVTIMNVNKSIISYVFFDYSKSQKNNALLVQVVIISLM